MRTPHEEVTHRIQCYWQQSDMSKIEDVAAIIEWAGCSTWHAVALYLGNAHDCRCAPCMLNRGETVRCL